MNSNTAGLVDRAAPRARLRADPPRRSNQYRGVGAMRSAAGAPSPFSRSGRPCY